ncbi:MAG TPA: FapA family protein [Bacillota bacterium]|nr:FapA family protein [Bacillota bacterium]
MDNINQMEILISSDKMSAFVRLPEEGNWGLAEIKRALNARGVVFGISDAAIKSCISGKRNTPYQVAWGLSPPRSQDGARSKLVLNFSHSRGRPPDTLTAGPAFRSKWSKLTSRGFVREKGILAFLRNPDRGSFGITVTGERIPFSGDEPLLICCDNTRLSEDGRYIIATKPGIPYVEGNQVGLLCSITIDGDIGPDTGDITFPGDLTVKGDVLQGFKVSTWGSLLVTGNLYGSAACAGSITVRGGIVAPGEVVASGDTITARYCENSVIRAVGDIMIADAVIHSIVETESALMTSQDAGRIVGGLAIAKEGVSTFSAGSTMGVPTVFEIGVSPKLRRRYENLKAQLASVQAELRRMKHAGLRPADQEGHRFDNLRLQRMRNYYEERQKELGDSLANVKQAIAEAKGGCFMARHVLPGTKILMGLREIRFDYPEQGVHIGGTLGETD